MALSMKMPQVKMPRITLPSFAFDVQRLLQKQTPRITYRQVGLCVGKEFVDLVEMRRGFKGPRLVNFASVPIATSPVTPSGGSPGAPGGEGVGFSTHEKILSAVRKAFRESGIRAKRIVSCLSEEEVIVRYFQMPRLPRREWDQAIRFEARKYIPFTLDELISDFSVIEEREEQGRMNIVFVAAKKEVVARHLALFGKAGIQVTHLEALPVSFMRLLYALHPEARKEACTCIVDVEGKAGSVILIKGGLPYLIRHISLEGPSPETTLPPETSSQETSFSPLLARLLDEVRLTSRYYRNQFPGQNLSRIFIFGEDVTPDISHTLSQELNIPVTLADPSTLIGSKVPARVGKSISLGLWGLSSGGCEIELLPPKAIPAPTKQIQFLKTLLLEGVGTLIVLIAVFSILSHRVETKKAMVERVKAKRPVVQVTSLSKEQLEKRKLALAQKMHLYQRLLDNRVFWTKKLSQLGSILPKGAWVTYLRLEDYSGDEFSPHDVTSRLVVKGSVYASDKSEELKIPSQFLTAIQQNQDFFEGFTEGKLVSVKRDEVEGVGVTSFEILLMGEERK